MYRIEQIKKVIKVILERSKKYIKSVKEEKYSQLQQKGILREERKL